MITTIYKLELEVEGIFDDILNSTCRSLEVERKFGSVLALLCVVRHKPKQEVLGLDNQHRTLLLLFIREFIFCCFVSLCWCFGPCFSYSVLFGGVFLGLQIIFDFVFAGAWAVMSGSVVSAGFYGWVPSFDGKGVRQGMRAVYCMYMPASTPESVIFMGF